METVVKKATTYSQTMFDLATNKASNLGLSFHEYLKHLIAKDISSDTKVSYVSNEIAKEVALSLKEHADNKYTVLNPRDISGLSK